MNSNDDNEMGDDPKGTIKNMSTKWYLMTEIDTNRNEYRGKVVPPMTCVVSEKIRFVGEVNRLFMDKMCPGEVARY